MRALSICFTLSLLLSAPAAWAQSTTTFTNSISHTQTFHNTNASVEVDNYLTRITARIGSGPLLFDQTFNVQLSDPTVQAAIQQARTQLTNAGGLCVTAPNQISNVKTPTGTMQNTVVNNTQVMSDIAGNPLHRLDAVQVLPRAGGEVVQRHHPPSAGHQLADQFGADETGRASDQRFHPAPKFRHFPLRK